MRRPARLASGGGDETVPRSQIRPEDRFYGAQLAPGRRDFWWTGLGGSTIARGPRRSTISTLPTVAVRLIVATPSPHR